MATSGVSTSTTSGGITGKLDVQYIVEQIISSKQQPIKDLQTFQSLYTARKTAFQELNTKVSALESALYDLDSSGFESKSATVSSETNLTASATTTASNGSYNIVVKQLASTQTSISAKFTSAESQLLNNGKLTIKNYDGTSTLGEIDFSSSTMSLNQLRDQINSKDIGVLATVVNFGTTASPDYRLQLTSEKTGSENAFNITETGTGTLPALTTSIAAKDAQFYVNTDPEANPLQFITRSSNTVSDVINGVTLKLKQKVDTPTLASGTTLTVSSNSTSIKDKIDKFITAFNDAMDYLNAQFKYDEQAGKSGVLSGESAAVQIKNDLLSLAAGRIDGIGDSDTYKTLSVAGIEMNREGKLEINSTKLDDTLSNHMEELKRLFKNLGNSSNAEVSYVGATATKTAAGKYNVFVKRAAERATAVGAENIAANLAQDENLTISYGGKNYSVALTSGMTNSQVVSAINTELTDKEIDAFAQINGGKLEILTNDYGSSQSISVNSDVDSAAGGTGIGTGTISDTGIDVAGYFKNSSGTTLAATGSGQILTGTAGDAKELIVEITTSSVTDTVNGDAKGAVTYTKGIGETLRRRASDISFPYTGLLAKNISALDTQLDNISTQISDIKRRLAVEEESLITQYTKANEALAQMDSILSQMDASSSS